MKIGQITKKINVVSHSSIFSNVKPCCLCVTNYPDPIFNLYFIILQMKSIKKIHQANIGEKEIMTCKSPIRIVKTIYWLNQTLM